MRRLFDLLTRFNMKQQLVLLFLVMVSPMLLLYSYGNAQAEKLLKNHVTSAYVELIKQNHTLINRDIDTINKITTTIIQNPVTQRLVPSGDDSVIERVRKYNDLDALLASNSIPLNGGEAVYYSLYIYDPQDYYFFAPKRQLMQTGVYFFSEENKPTWFDSAISKKGKGYMDIIEANVGLTPIRTLAYMRAVNDVSSGNRLLGVLVATKMDIKIEESLRAVSLPEGKMFLTDSSNRILSSTEEEAGGEMYPFPSGLQEVENDGASGTYSLITADSIYIVNTNSQLDQKLIYQIPMGSLLKQQSELKQVIQLISIVYMLLGCVILVYFWRSLMTPLQKLSLFVRSYEPGKLVPETPGRRRRDEMGVLMTAFYDMARRLNGLIHYKYQMDIKQKEAQLQLLYQQINPHLLYNTLESIYWKSVLEGGAESSEMIKELSKLMKIGLSKGRELIALEEELEHAKAYVALQLKRFAYEFVIEWQVPEAALELLIPKISLQPLIENAIVHSVKAMGEDGLILISVQLEGERATIKVEDNGHKEVDLAAIDKLLNAEEGDHQLGYGIRNIHQRIRLHFGLQYGLRYSKREGGGLAASIVLPIRYEKEWQREDGEEEGS
ncbi:sensor histidine kinase [Paenibacillus sp. HB172176]|uniref:cache domain-containing sensor histidine kinase n=1 Tax=Paenibacillus sp. HB172176 TaxID=2493690 RepID=UPI00143965DC|nr:sensor histidine kinase [Paenibacillus sp. HB172176]